jgi:amino acid permease
MLKRLALLFIAFLSGIACESWLRHLSQDDGETPLVVAFTASVIALVLAVILTLSNQSQNKPK